MTTEVTAASRPATDDPVLVHADSAVVKRFGDWTTARRFDVRVRRGQAVLDLRSAQIPAGGIEICLDADRGVLKLLVAENARIDSAGLRWAGRGRLKDLAPCPAGGGRNITITGMVRGGEIRVHRGGMAILASLSSRAELRRMHREHQQAQQSQRAITG
jgi:hypothetical protein